MRKQDEQLESLTRILSDPKKRTQHRLNDFEKIHKARSKLNYFVGKIASHDPRIGSWNGMPVVKPTRAFQKAAIF